MRDGSPAECDQGGAGPDFQHDRAWARGGFHGCAEADGLAELVAPVERRWRILDLVARERRDPADAGRLERDGSSDRPERLEDGFHEWRMECMRDLELCHRDVEAAAARDKGRQSGLGS